MQRCMWSWDVIDSRCILPQGHEGQHIFPNAILKESQPELFENMRKTDLPITPEFFRQSCAKKPSTQLVFTGTDDPLFNMYARV